MAEKLTDRVQIAVAVAQTDLVHIVDVSDTSQDPAGSSYKGTAKQLINSYVSDGSEGALSYWDSSTSKYIPISTSGIYHDASNNRIGVGINTGLSAKLHVKSASGTAFQVDGSVLSSIFSVLNNADIIGTNILAWQAGTTKLGYNTAVGGTNSTAIGLNASSFGYFSSAYGYNSSSGAAYSTAIGTQCVTTGDGGSVAMGFDSSVSSDSGIAVGYLAQSTGPAAIVFGNRNSSSGSQSSTFGLWSQSLNSRGIAIGYHAYSQANNAIVIGSGVNALTTTPLRNTIADSVAFGFSEETPTILLAKSNDSYINNGTNGFVSSDKNVGCELFSTKFCLKRKPVIDVVL